MLGKGVFMEALTHWMLLNGIVKRQLLESNTDRLMRRCSTESRRMCLQTHKYSAGTRALNERRTPRGRGPAPSLLII